MREALMLESEYWVYILLCENGAYYTGYTTALARRYAEHLAGTAKCKYTRSFKPVALVCSWRVVGDKMQALKMENHIKRLSKKEKELLISDPKQLTQVFDCEIFCQ